MEFGTVLIGRYLLADRIATGGTSVVWRAHDRVLSRDVAVKVLAAPAPGGAANGALAEGKAAARLSHANVASVFDYGETTDAAGRRVAFVVMELLPGTSLAELLAAGPMPPATAVRIGAEVAAGLAAAHEQGLVHRDIKPGNIMITPDGAKIVDFGIAALVGTDDDPGPHEPIIGTPAYLAPERLAGEPVTPATDVYAIGVVLYRLIANELPWPDRSATETMIAHMYEEAPVLPPVEGVGAAVRDLHRRCLAKDPADRPSAQQVAAVLGRAADDMATVDDFTTGHTIEGAATTFASPLLPALATTTPRRGARAAPVLAAVGAVLVGAVLVAYLGRSSPPTTGSSQVPPDSGAVTMPAATTPPAGDAPTATDQSGASAERLAHPTGGPGPVGGAVLSPVPSPTSNAVHTSPPSGTPTQTFTSPGGTIVAGCDGANAYLASWTPADGYRVKNVSPGPAGQAVVTFKLKSAEDTMTASCPSGVPHVVLTSTS